MSVLNPKAITKYFKDQKPPDLEKLRKEGKKFEDPYFPPNYNSLTSRNSDGTFVDKFKGEELFTEFNGEDELCSQLQWKRASEVIKNYALFEGVFEVADLNQGLLGDCYFIACIAALCKYPYLLKEKFRTTEANPEGYYELIFFIDGEWQIVFVDDYFPYSPDEKTFAFARPNGKEIYAILFEKCWAKINGGYTNIIEGSPDEPFLAITGFPTDRIFNFTKNPNSDSYTDIDQLDLFLKLNKANKEGTIMTSGTKELTEKIADKMGLVSSHAYTLIDIKGWDEKDLFLLKLRNPWGSGDSLEWKGDYGDKSNKWTKELMNYFKYEKKSDNIFWMDIENYIKYYLYTSISYLLYNAIIKTYNFEYQKYLNWPVVFNIQITEKSETSISALFKSRRFNRELNNVIHPFNIILAKYNEKREIENFYSRFSLDSDISIVEDLEPGNYVLWAMCSYKHVQNDDNFKYVLQISSVKDFNIEFIGIDRNFQLIQYILIQNYKNVNDNINMCKDYFVGRDNELEEFGFYPLLFYNKSSKWLNVQISATFDNKDGRLLPPYEDLNNFELKVPPKQSSSVIAFKASDDFDPQFVYEISLNEGNGEEIPPENKFEDYLHLTISNDTNSEAIQELKVGTLKFISKEEADDIPTFEDIPEIQTEEPKKEEIKKEEFKKEEEKKEEKKKEEKKEEEKKEKEIKIEEKKIEEEKIEEKKEETKKEEKKKEEEIKKKEEEIKKEEPKKEEPKKEEKKIEEIIYDKSKAQLEYPYEMKLIEEKFQETIPEIDLKESKEIEYKWEKRIKEGYGTYIGQIDPITKNMHGRGIFIFNKINKKYIGYYYQGKPNIKGILLDKNNKIIYEGEYKNGIMEGEGKMYFGEKSYYEGTFFNNKMNGKGIFYFEDGNSWEGNFKDGKKDGIGMMNYANNSLKNLVEYENDHFIAKKGLLENEMKSIISFKLKKLEEEKKEKKRKEEMKNNFIKGIGALVKKTSQKIDEEKLKKAEEELKKQEENRKQEEEIKKKIFYKKIVHSNVSVFKLDKIVKHTEEEKKHDETLQNIEKFKSTEPFLISQLLEIYPISGEKENIQMIILDKEKEAKYIGGIINENIKNGRGALFDGENYYIGYFKNDKPKGFCRKFHKKENEKILEYKGIIDENYNFILGTFYYEDGKKYKGKFLNNLPNGFGVLYETDGSSFAGNFINGKPDGQGKKFLYNGLVSQEVTYKNGEYIKNLEGKKMKEDFRDPNTEKFIEEINKKYPRVIEHLFTMKPSYKNEAKMEWVESKLNDAIYIGKKTSNGILSGRCCLIYPDNKIENINENKEIKYYVGYISNNVFQGDGNFYDKNWNILFKGKFNNNKKTDYGIQINSDGTKYSGFFQNDLYHGLGIINYPNGSRLEGNFVNGLNEDKATIISSDATKKQNVKFKNGNIIEQEEFIKCQKKKYKAKQNQAMIGMRILHGKFINDILSLPKTKDNLVLNFEIKNYMKGFYIGEVNSIGLRHGRGMLAKKKGSECYLGYFINNLKEGYGKIFSKPGELYYEGNFSFDKPYGKGKYYFPNGETLEGEFNEIGEGNGIYTFKDGSYYDGLIYALTCHGKGRIRGKNGVNYGKKEYYFGKLESERDW